MFPPTTPYQIEITNQVMSTNEELLIILEQQELIGPGNKAIVHFQTMFNDTSYSTCGDMGRWMMNTFIREKDSGSRREVCEHIEWLVLAIDGMVAQTCKEHQRLENITSSLLMSIGRLMKTYPIDGDSVHDLTHPYNRLGQCMVRLLKVNGSMETHV
jgi:hypothetical protein